MRSILFLRRVNVDGSRLRMSDLLETVAVAGYPSAVSVVASGNLIVWSDTVVDTNAVEHAIESAHGFRSEVYMRSEDDVRLLPQVNPFTEIGGKVEIVVLPEALDPTVIDEIANIATGPDRLQVVGSEIFWWRPLPLEPPIPKEKDLRRALSCHSTRRTLGTVERIIAKLDDTPR